MTIAVDRADKPVQPHVDDYGWQCAEGCSRGQAAAWFARYCGELITEVRVWKRYVRPLIPGESDDDDAEPPAPPRIPPADWEPDWELDPAWEFVHRSHPDAVAVWVCCLRGDGGPPPNPGARAIDWKDGS